MATDTVVASAKVVTGPETLDSGAKKWVIVLDNGSMIATFSEAAFNAVNGKLDTPLTFEVEVNDKGWTPKLTKVSENGTVLWAPGGGGGGFRGGGGFGRNEEAETARRAVGSAVAIISSWQAAAVGSTSGPGPMTVDEMLKLIAELSPGIHDIMKDLEK